MSIKINIRNWIPAFAGMTICIGIITFQLLYSRTTIQTNINTLKVTTSFYPLAFLAETIGGNNVLVTNLTPPGAEPHDFEPSTRDIAELETQDIILLNGGGLEGYENKIKANINLKKTTLIIAGKPLMSNPQDPHVWLDPILFKKETQAIAAVLITKDPVHAGEYTQNMQELSREIDLLDREFKKGLENCRQNSIISSHKAFEYLAKRYGFNEVSLAGLSPEEEPLSKTLAEIASFAKKNTIRYIFFEELVSPSIAETIAREVGAKTLILNPLEGLTNENKKAGKTYISIQRENLKNLQIALDCK